MAWLELLTGVSLAALALLRDALAGRPFELGLRQAALALAALGLVADALVRLRRRDRAGLVGLALAPGIAGDVVALAIGGALLACALGAFARYVVDDSFITFRFGSNLLHGGRPAWNPGEPPVEGYSNFLWMLLSAGSLALRLDPLAVARAVSALALGVSAALVHRLASRAGGPVAGRLSLLAFLSVPAYAMWAMSGLETLSVVALFLALLSVLDDDLDARRRPWRSVLAGVLLALSRPEGGVLFALVLAPALFERRGPARRRALGIGGAVAALLAPYLVWKWLAFGSLLPNSVIAKSHPFSGVPLVIDVLPLALPFAPLAAWSLARGGSRIERQVWLAFAGSLVAALGVSPQVGHHARFFLPVFAGVLAFSGVYLERLAGAIEVPRRRPAFLAAAGGALVFALFSPVLPMQTETRNEIAGLDTGPRAVARALASAYGPEGVLVASDCGLMPYLTRMRTIDLFGLCDPHIARHGADAVYVLARRPDVVVLNSLSPNEFVGREGYDQVMYAALGARSELPLRGRWPFTGYWLWVWSRRPLPAEASGRLQAGNLP
jgi:hypothetical protein